MIFRLSSLALGLLSTAPLTNALSTSEIPTDTPVSQLLKDASIKLATGNAQDALTYFDVAISRDPKNYLTFFKRGAAYLSLGRTVQAQSDFDKVLELKPGFEGALVNEQTYARERPTGQPRVRTMRLRARRRRLNNLRRHRELQC